MEMSSRHLVCHEASRHAGGRVRHVLHHPSQYDVGPIPAAPMVRIQSTIFWGITYTVALLGETWASPLGTRYDLHSLV